MKRAYIGMSADPPHEGHLRLIRRVKELGFEPLIVLNSDTFIEDYKQRRVHTPQEQRIEYFESKGYDTLVVEQHLQRKNIILTEPSVIVVGTDWMKPEILPQLGIDEDFLEAHNIAMLFLTRTKGISSTELRK